MASHRTCIIHQYPRRIELRTGVCQTYDRVPLVQAEGEVSVRSNPLGVVGVHDGLGGRADSDGDFEVLVTTAQNISQEQSKV